MRTSTVARLVYLRSCSFPEFARFQGDIAPGEYGAGRVKLDDLRDIVIKKSGDDKIHFHIAKGQNRGEYTMFRTDGPNWLAVRHKDRPEYFKKRKKYRNKGEVPSEAWTSSKWIGEEKKDGAGTIAVLDKNKGISYISAREPAGGLPIHRTWNVSSGGG